jgi:hypothetical protein
MTVPQHVTGCDVRNLALSPEEEFVFSKIDGRRTLGDLAAITGVDREAVAGIIARLLELRAIWIAGPLTTYASTTGPWPSAALIESIPIDIEIDWTSLEDEEQVTAPYSDRPSQRPTIPAEPPDIDWSR